MLEEGSIPQYEDKRAVADNLVRHRTLVYLEGDASMSTYQDKEGKTQSSLNVIQTKIDVLKRPQPREETTA